MMSYDQLNAFIENYLVNDKSQRALMLTAPWGTGKSFYIKNYLCPHLQSKNLKYAVVSLYGMTSIKDISKNIYLEIRTKGILDKNEKVSASWMLGKTVIKGIASFFNVDLNQNKKDLERLYKSIDLSNRLIILEDLERTKLDIVEVLGFINNLVEQDGVKVLIVSNEDEIIKYEENTGENKEKKLTQESKDYLKIKEKTIGDTIHFTSNIIDSITSIVSSFNNPIFDKLLEEKDPTDEISFSRRVYQQLLILKCFNLRSVLYACQKMEEITKKVKFEFDLKFIENLFIGTICYSVKFNNNGNRIWDSQSYTSPTLGSFAYPLYKVVFDYIENHIFNNEDFEKTRCLFNASMNYSETDEEIKPIFNFYVTKEKNLSAALNALKSKLELNKDLFYNDYGRIANYLIAIKYEVGFEDIVTECLDLMIKNIKHAIDTDNKIEISESGGIQLMSKEAIEDYQKFLLKIQEYQKQVSDLLKEFTYKPEDLANFHELLIKNKRTFIGQNGFADKLDITRLVLMLKTSSAKEIHEFRGIIQHIYLSFSNIKDFFLCDLPALKELVTQLDSIDFEKENIDKIQKLQINWLKENLKEVIGRLER